MSTILWYQRTSVGIKMDEEDKCITLLCSLPDSWDNLIVAIGSSSQVTLKFDVIVSSLMSEYMRRKPWIIIAWIPCL